MSKLLSLLSRNSLSFLLQLPSKSSLGYAPSIDRHRRSTPAAVASTAASKPTCVSSKKAVQNQGGAISDIPVITPGTTSTDPDIATGDYEADINSTNETAPRSQGVAILWDLDNTPLKSSQPFAVAQRLRQVVKDKYGPVQVLTAYANKATLDHVPKWALDDAKDLYKKTLLYEKENDPEKPYRCNICGQKSTTLVKLEKHVKKLHERERRKKVNHLASKRKGTKKREKLQTRYGPYLEKFKETVGGLVPKVDYDVDKELTRAMVEVKRVGHQPEAADEALKAHASKLWSPRTQNDAQEKRIDCLVLVSDDTGFVNMLKRAKKAGIKTVQVGGKCVLRRVADEHMVWNTLLEEAKARDVVRQQGLQRHSTD